MLPQLKIYKIDYDFIISNYLDVSLWDKVWNLFVYKEHIFTLELDRIKTKDKVITFLIKKNGYSSYEYIDYNLKNSNITILKKQINGAIYRLIEHYESHLIYESPGYKSILNNKDSERDRLREIAIDFLNNEGVTNSEIRDAYISVYIDKNEKVWSMLNNYQEQMKYTILPDLYITFCKIIKDDSRLLSVMKGINSRDKIKAIMNTVNEFMEYLETDEYYDDMKNELEGI